jgi:hypothetical protein
MELRRATLFVCALAAACGSDDPSDPTLGGDPSAGPTSVDPSEGSDGGSSSDDGVDPSTPTTDDPSADATSDDPGSTSDDPGTTTDSGGAADFDALCASPGVIFCDDFEGGMDSAWLEDGGDVRFPAGAALEGVGETVVELATYADQQSSKLIYVFPDTDEIYIRFDVQYDITYDNTGGSHGPVLSGSMSPPWGAFGTAGIKPSGDDFFVLNFEPNNTVGDGGTFHFYAYFVNMLPDGHGDYWGNYFDSTMQPPPTIVPGQWQCVEYGMTLNDPASDDGLADFWVDGVHHGHFDGFIWRTVPELQINTFSLDSYNHFNNGPLPPETPNLVRYDNVIVSSQPVGCLAGQ